jgi:hypothetical protein
VGVGLSKRYSELQAGRVSAGAVVPESCEGLGLEEITKFVEDLE